MSWICLEYSATSYLSAENFLFVCCFGFVFKYCLYLLIYDWQSPKRIHQLEIWFQTQYFHSAVELWLQYSNLLLTCSIGFSHTPLIQFLHAWFFELCENVILPSLRSKLGNKVCGSCMVYNLYWLDWYYLAGLFVWIVTSFTYMWKEGLLCWWLELLVCRLSC